MNYRNYMNYKIRFICLNQRLRSIIKSGKQNSFRFKDIYIILCMLQRICSLNCGQRISIWDIFECFIMLLVCRCMISSDFLDNSYGAQQQEFSSLTHSSQCKIATCWSRTEQFTWLQPFKSNQPLVKNDLNDGLSTSNLQRCLFSLFKVLKMILHAGQEKLCSDR